VATIGIKNENSEYKSHGTITLRYYVLCSDPSQIISVRL